MIRKAVSYILIPKKWAYTFVITFTLLSGYYFLRPQSTPVDAKPLTRGLFKKTIVDEGVTHFKNRYTLSAPADGVTPTVQLKAGDAVKKGQVLLVYAWDVNVEIRSPVDGYILNVFEKDRRPVGRGTPLLEVGDPSELEIITKLLSEDVVSVRVGQKAEVQNWGHSSTLSAEVVKIEPTAREEVSALGVKEQRVNVHLKITSPRDIWKTLGDAFRVDVAIILNEKPNTLLVPVGALFTHQSKPAVYVIQDNRLEIQYPELGDRNSEFAEVLNGIFEGQQVVLYPDSKLQVGVRAKSRE